MTELIIIYLGYLFRFGFGERCSGFGVKVRVRYESWAINEN